MPRMRVRLLYVSCAVAALLAACSTENANTGPDASVGDSAQSDAARGLDGATDGASSDASGRDVGGNQAGDDAGNDASADSGLDAGIDGGSDAAIDGGTDAAIDGGTDAAIDGGTDAAIDGGTDAAIDGGTDAAIDGGTDANAGPTFSQVYLTIISGRCTGCHGGSGGLNMSTQATAYANLVNVMAAGAACGSSGQFRVVPGSSATSLLFNKVNGTQTCGAQMPRGGAALPAAQVALIQSWIDHGALNN